MALQIPEKQWAQVVEKRGGPPIYKQIPVPKPGPDEVLVKIKYSGVCHTDLHAMKGDWPLPLKLPLVGGRTNSYGMLSCSPRRIREIFQYYSSVTQAR